MENDKECCYCNEDFTAEWGGRWNYRTDRHNLQDKLVHSEDIKDAIKKILELVEGTKVIDTNRSAVRNMTAIQALCRKVLKEKKWRIL